MASIYAEVQDLAKITTVGIRYQKKAILLRGYVKADRAGVFSVSRVRELAAYLNKLADEAEAWNRTAEGSSPWLSGTATI